MKAALDVNGKGIDLVAASRISEALYLRVSEAAMRAGHQQGATYHVANVEVSLADYIVHELR